MPHQVYFYIEFRVDEWVGQSSGSQMFIKRKTDQKLKATFFRRTRRTRPKTTHFQKDFSYTKSQVQKHRLCEILLASLDLGVLRMN